MYSLKLPSSFSFSCHHYSVRGLGVGRTNLTKLLIQALGFQQCQQCKHYSTTEEIWRLVGCYHYHPFIIQAFFHIIISQSFISKAYSIIQPIFLKAECTDRQSGLVMYKLQVKIKVENSPHCSQNCLQFCIQGFPSPAK